MLEGKALDKAIEQMMQRMRSVNLLYIRKVAMQIRKIGELGQASINRLVAMADFNADIAEIKERLRLIAAVNAKELRQVLTKAVNETYTDPRFRRYLAEYPLKNAQRQRIERYVQTVYRQTAARMYNFSNTTAVTQGYSDAVDKAILATSTGVASYTETMRDTIRELGHAGLQVQYESGYRRRLDTAVRQNIVDVVNQINKTAGLMLGDELGYDAVEISAHARSAPDHEPVQGHVFLKEEFEKMQSGLSFHDIDGKVYEGFRRPIGEWNCGHTPMSFDTRYSERKWTDAQLREFIDENQAGCVIDGKHRTLYEASQMMRNIETQVRREKDTAIAAQAAGDDVLRQQCQQNINALVRKYAEIAKASGNAEKRQRMTVEGFKPVKVPPSNPEKPTNSPQPPENSQKGLTSGGKSAMMKSEKMALPKNEEKIKWLPKGKEISAETRRELTEYAAERGMVLKGLRRSDVDPELIKEMIDTAEEMLRKYPELNSNPNLPFTLKVVNGMDANDFAMTTRYQDINVVQLNANAFRDKNKLEEEYDKLVKERWFAQGTSYRSIIVHEIGHMYQRRRHLSDEDIVNIAMRVSGISDKKALFRYIESDLSRYASRYKEGTEILSEVFSSFYSGNSQSVLASGMMSLKEMR